MPHQDARRRSRKQAELLARLADQMWLEEGRIAAGASLIVGVDEVGRGCIAGPVYAAAVVLSGRSETWIGIRDSKLIKRDERESLYEYIHEHALNVSFAQATVEEIESLNILHASRLAMGRAVMGLDLDGSDNAVALIDGTFDPLYESEGNSIPSLPVVDGDARCLSIAAASIVAKVERDRYMALLANQFPEYGFEHNVGYGTPEHLRALRSYGPTPHHRRSFAPVRSVLHDSIQTELSL